MKTTIPPCPQCGQQVLRMEAKQGLQIERWRPPTTIEITRYQLFPCEHIVSGMDFAITKEDDGKDVETFVYLAAPKIVHYKPEPIEDAVTHLGLRRYTDTYHTADHSGECTDC